jgi:hypothetical protein
VERFEGNQCWNFGTFSGGYKEPDRNRIGTEIVIKFQHWRLREEGKGERVKRT